MVYLPSELVELILEQLKYELRPTLRACALVCKAWLPTALRFLFHRFSLSPDSRFVQSLDTHVHLVFPHYVRELTIYTPGGSPSELKDILPHLSRFDRVHRLFLNLWGPHNNIVYHLPHTHLRELDLHFISFPDFYSLQVFVATFSQLEVLFVHAIGQNSNGPQPNVDIHPGDLRPPPHLRVLKYSSAGDYRIPFLHWLSVHSPTLENLTLSGILSSELESTGALLCALGPHLRTFRISFDKVNTALAHPLFHTNTHMHTLYIALSQGSPGVPVLLALLGSANPALRCVTLKLLLYQYIHDNEWRALDATLTHAPSLECLHIGVYAMFDFDAREFDRVAKECMPYCSENGILDSLGTMDRNQARIPAHGKLRRIPQL